MPHREDGDLAEDVDRYLRQLAAVVESANKNAETADIAWALAEAQRVAAWALRSAVQLGREGGMSWRQLADVLDVPASTLHRQYSRGTAIVTVSESLPPLPAAAPIRSEVPRGYDDFVGRERELADLADLVFRTGLVSLIGPVGVGKSRLAAELARRVHPSFPGGVFWLDLASLTRITQVATVVGASDRYVDAGPSLLVIDNCEQVIDGVIAAVTRLRAVAPQVHLLLTSQEALRLPGERLVPVAPLGAQAVDLFRTRALEVRPDFDAGHHAAAVAEICERLDGLPLAIELAAHQMDVMAPEVLLAKLSQRLDVLVDVGRAANRHRRGLREAIGASYELLDPVQSQVFARLSVLPGGFDQQSAAAVTVDLGLTRPQLWALLADLIRKSLIVQDPQRPDRFRMLQSLRAYGQEALISAGQQALAQGLLLQWLATFEQRLRARPWGSELTALEQQIALEADNLDHAVTVAGTSGHPQYAVVAILLSRSLAHAGDLAGVELLLRDVLLRPETSRLQRSHALSWLAQNDARQGHHQSAIQHAQSALDLAQELNDMCPLILALTSVMLAHGSAGDLPAALQAGKELIARLRPVDRPDLTGQILGRQASLLIAEGDLEAAREAITESMTMFEAQADSALPLARRFANHYGITLLHSASVTALLQGDDAVAREYGTAVLSMPVLDLDTVLLAVEGAAILAVRRRQYVHALTLLAGAASRRPPGQTVPDYWMRAVAAARTTAMQAVGTAAAEAAAQAGFPLSVVQLTDLALEGGALPGDDPAGVLTRREFAVARCVTQGMTNAQIGRELSISAGTVASHLANVRRKLGVDSRVEIALWVVGAGRSRGPGARCGA